MPEPLDSNPLGLEFDSTSDVDRELLDVIVDNHELDDPFDSDIAPVRSVSIEDRDAYITLALVNGIGPRMMAALIDHFGSATEVLKANLAQLGRVRRVGPKLATSIRDAASSGLYERVRTHCEDNEVSLVLPGDRNFPKLLMELADPPVLLFLRGQLVQSDQLSIAMVGTRHASYYGRTMAERLAGGLARFGLTIVSGLARGIDAVCHRAAIDASGRTIGVLGSSVTDIYPPEHRELAEQITEHGALISETNPFAKPKAGVFPQRNRIISGLSLGVIVVEAADRSGSLITAQHAGTQGRDVFAIPGPVTSRTSRGCNQLIRDGAILIQDAEDVINHLGPLAHRAEVEQGVTIHHPSELQLNDVESTVLQAIETIPTDIDQIIATCGLEVPRVLSTISILEIRGHIVRTSGRSVARRV